MFTTGTEQTIYHRIANDGAPDRDDTHLGEEAADDHHLLRPSEDSEGSQRHTLEPMTVSDGPDNSKRNSSWWPSGRKGRVLGTAILCLGIVLSVPTIVLASHKSSPSDPSVPDNSPSRSPVPEPSAPTKATRKLLPICFVGGDIRVNPSWLSAGHASTFMTQGPSRLNVKESWCTDVNLDELIAKGSEDQTLRVDVSGADGVTRFTLYPSRFDLKPEQNHFRSLVFDIDPANDGVFLHAKFSDDISELPWKIRLECGTVCNDTKHPDGQKVLVPWSGDWRYIISDGSKYQCRYKPDGGNPCPSADQGSDGPQDNTDLQRPVESAFSGIPS